MISLARPYLGREEEEAVLRVLRRGQLAAGEEVHSLEEEFAALCGTRWAIATSSGTTALHLALLALGLQAGDKVLTTPFTFVATANAILMCGAQPVFADIDPVTYNLDPQAAARVLAKEPNIRGILAVHLYGLPADVAALGQLAREYGVWLLEDCAQAPGASVNDRPVGSFGEAGAFSFYATKNLACGEGGMVTTSSPGVAERARLLVNHGSREKYLHEILGYNYRLSDLAAAVARVQLQRLPTLNERRRANAALLGRKLQGKAGLSLPCEPPGRRHVYHQYTVRLKPREELRTYLASRGVETAVHYPLPLHRQPIYHQLGYAGENLAQAEAAACEVLSLPVHPGLTREQLREVIRLVKEF